MPWRPFPPPRSRNSTTSTRTSSTNQMRRSLYGCSKHADHHPFPFSRRSVPLPLTSQRRHSHTICSPQTSYVSHPKLICCRRKWAHISCYWNQIYKSSKKPLSSNWPPRRPPGGSFSIWRRSSRLSASTETHCPPFCKTSLRRAIENWIRSISADSILPLSLTLSPSYSASSPLDALGIQQGARVVQDNHQRPLGEAESKEYSAFSRLMA